MDQSSGSIALSPSTASQAAPANLGPAISSTAGGPTEIRIGPNFDGELATHTAAVYTAIAANVASTSYVDNALQ
jgi:hypothetical protein